MDRPTATTPGFSIDGREFADGSYLSWPTADGYIALRDSDGDLVDSWNVEDSGWRSAANHFGITADDTFDFGTAESDIDDEQ